MGQKEMSLVGSLISETEELPYDPASLLRIETCSNKTYDVQSSTIPKSPNNPNVCQLMMDKPNVSVHTMKHYSAIKRNAVVRRASQWMNLEDIK